MNKTWKQRQESRRAGAWLLLAAPVLGAWALASPSLPARAKSAAPPAPYAAACQSCHKPDGGGMPGVFPRLTGRLGPAARSREGRQWLIAAVLFGQSGAIEVDGKTIRGAMPAVARLSDAEVAATLGWLAGGGKPFTAAEVAAARALPGMTAAKVGTMRETLATAGTIR